MKLKMGKKAVCGILILAMGVIIATGVLLFQDKINGWLSYFPTIADEGNAEIENYNEDYSTVSVGPGQTLTLPVQARGRMGHYGVMLGKQPPASNAQYIMELRDERENVIGKIQFSLDEVRENDFFSLSLQYRTYADQAYTLLIYTEEVDAPPLVVNVNNSNGLFPNISIDGAEQPFSLITSVKYNTIKNYAVVIALAIVALSLLAVLFMQSGVRVVISRGARRCASWLKAWPWKRILQAVMLLALAANVVLIVFPQTERRVNANNFTGDNEAKSNVSLLDDIVVEQTFESQQDEFDTIGFLFATYSDKVQAATVHMELLDAAGSVIATREIASEKIADNEYSYFDIEKQTDTEGKSYTIRLYTDGCFVGNEIAVYTNEKESPQQASAISGVSQSGNTVFEAASLTHRYPIGESVAVNLLLILSVLVYLFCFVTVPKPIRLTVILAVSLIGVMVMVSAYLKYQTISIGAISNLIQSAQSFPQVDFDKQTINRNTDKYVEYRMNGTAQMIQEHLNLNNINLPVNRVTLLLEPEKMLPRQLNIRVFWDTGKGYRDSESVMVPFVNDGTNQITLHIPTTKAIRSLRVDSMVGDQDGGVSLTQRAAAVKAVTINARQEADESSAFIVCLIVFAALFIFIAIWYWGNVGTRVSEWARNRKISVVAVFVLLASLFGLSLSFLVPTGQVPDERAHIGMLYSDMGDAQKSSAFLSALSDNGTTGVMNNNATQVDIPKYLQAMDNPLSDYSFDFQDGNFINALARRPGQAIGVLLGQLLRLPAYWILQLGEIFGLAVYILICALALKRMPFKRSMMMFIMLLPVAMQEAGSFAYDSMNNALSFFTIAYILDLKFTQEKVTLKNILVLLLLAVLLLANKFIYALLLLLVFIIPLSKLEVKLFKLTINKEFILKHKLLDAAVIAVVAATGVGMFFVIAPGGIVEMVGGYLSRLTDIVRLLLVSAVEKLEMYVTSAVGWFGWMDALSSPAFTVFVVIMAFVFAFMHHDRQTNPPESGATATQSKKGFTAFNVVWWYLVFVMMFFVALLTMVAWSEVVFGGRGSVATLDNIRLYPRIEGVQGRYFIPILPLLFIPLHTKKDFLHFLDPILTKIVYYAVAMIYPIGLLLTRYWI